MRTLTVYPKNALSDFDRYLGTFFGDSLLAPAKSFCHMPAVDIQETESAYVLDMELPGYDEKNIEVNLDGSNLSIASKKEESAEKKDEGDAAQEKKGSFILRERKSSAFSRSFKLPENADPDAVNAAFKNGVLTLQISKRAEAQKRTIQINAA